MKRKMREPDIDWLIDEFESKYSDYICALDETDNPIKETKAAKKAIKQLIIALVKLL